MDIDDSGHPSTDAAAPPPFAPDKAPSEDTGIKKGPRTLRRLIRVLLISVIGAFCVTGALAWWGGPHRVVHFPASNTDAKVDESLLRYYSGAGEEISVVTEEVRQALATLEPDLKGLRQAVTQTQRQMSASDPHLALALASDIDTPLVGPDGGKKGEDFYPSQAAVIERFINEYSQKSSDDAKEKADLRDALRAILYAKWTGTPADMPMWERLTAAYQSGNRDPLLLYALLLPLTSGSDERYDLVIEAVEALEQRETSPFPTALITTKLVEFRDPMTQQEYVLGQIRARDDLFAAIADNADDDAALRTLTTKTIEVFESMNGWGRGQFLIAAVERSDEEMPRWLKHYIAYLATQSVAAHHRGTDFISQVSEVDLARFGEFSDLQSKYLLKAWALHPSDVRLCRDLLRSEQWAGATGTSVHDWFRYTVAQSCDDWETFRDYAYAIYPRWGGSEDELLNLAELCVSHGDPGSLVQLYFDYPMIEVMNLHLSQIPYDNDRRFERIALKVVDYLKTSTHPGATQLFTGIRPPIITKILWDFGRFEEVKWLLETYPDAFTEGCAYDLCLNIPLMTAVRESVTDENKAHWKRIHRDLLVHSIRLNSRKIDQVNSAIEELRKEADERLLPTLDELQRVTLWADQFHRGEEVVLKVDEDFEGWNKWLLDATSFEEGIEIRVRNDHTVGLLTPLLQFPLPHSFEADLQLVGESSDFFGIGLFAGIAGSELSTNAYNGLDLRYRPAYMSLAMDQLPGNRWASGRSTPLFYKIHSLNKCRFRMEVYKEGIKSMVDNVPLRDRPGPVMTHGILQIGRYSPIKLRREDDRTSTYRVTNIRVKRLDVDVPEPADEGFPVLLY